MTLELKDLQLTCSDCRGEFTFSIDSQQTFAERGWQWPKRCRGCSKQRGREGQTNLGVVISFNASKGWGFIGTGNGEDVFVHYTQILGHEQDYKTLVAGQTVEFDKVSGRGGKPAAANVRVVEG